MHRSIGFDRPNGDVLSEPGGTLNYVTSERVLDLRPQESQSTADPLLLTRATASGSACGWTVEAQRRQAKARDTKRGEGGSIHMLSTRLTAPDGRVLHVVGSVSTSATNAKGPTTTMLGAPVGLTMRAGQTERQAQTAAQALERIFALAWDTYAEPVGQNTVQDRSQVHLEVQCAAYDLPVESVRQIQQEYTSAGGPGQFDVSRCALLIEADLPMSTAFRWLPSGWAMRGVTDKQITQISRLDAAGWTPEEAQDLARLLRLRATVLPPVAWSKLTAEQAHLSVTAGLSAAEAVALIRAGKFDPDLVSALAALRQGGEPASLLPC